MRLTDAQVAGIHVVGINQVVFAIDVSTQAISQEEVVDTMNTLVVQYSPRVHAWEARLTGGMLYITVTGILDPQAVINYR